MNTDEALAVLDEALARFRLESYAHLVNRISESPINFEQLGPSGTTYQVEIQVFWNGRPGHSVRVLASVDDGRGWRAFVPLTRGFLKGSDETVEGG